MSNFKYIWKVLKNVPNLFSKVFLTFVQSSYKKYTNSFGLILFYFIYTIKLFIKKILKLSNLRKCFDFLFMI